MPGLFAEHLPESPITPWGFLQKSMPDTEVKDFRCSLADWKMMLAKAEPGQDDEVTGRRWHQGVTSTPYKDLQGEEVIAKGLNIRYFKDHGYFNDDHQQGNEFIVGEPTVAEIKKVKDRSGKSIWGMWTRGFIWAKGIHPRADHVVNLARAKEASGSRSPMSYSIEGKVLQRAAGKILKAWVKAVAITASPINTMTWMELVEEVKKGFVSVEEMTQIAKSISLDNFGDDSEFIEEPPLEGKALTVASAGSFTGKNTPTLVPESLEGTKILTFQKANSQDFEVQQLNNCVAKSKRASGLEGSLRFSYDQFIERGYPPQDAWRYARVVVARSCFASL